MFKVFTAALLLGPLRGIKQSLVYVCIKSRLWPGIAATLVSIFYYATCTRKCSHSARVSSGSQL